MARNEPQRLRATIQAVKELILDQGLQPGDPLPTEAQLVDLLDVSRGNLREAVRTLVALDILEVRHGTGTFVGQMSLRPLVEGLGFRGVVLPGEDFQSLRQIVEVRSGLDHALADAVVERMDDDVAVELKALCDAMAEHSERNEAFAAEDRAFHLALASMLGNELYSELVAAFWDVHTRLAPRLGVPTPRDIADTVAAHRAMLDAAVSRDLEGYRAAVGNHYAPLLRVLDSTSTTG
ncbi:FadR/GntR family transcriptional regulator [Tessaracoccus lapidicaptus]|uniref:FadR/GntR family transcriptional regulator n=1 Tax=Tessaracoccus lapidicaptus TaxID=1427523 RepID=UPI00333EAB2B